MLATTRERRPLSFLATTLQSGPIIASKASVLSVMGMQAIQLFVFYPAPGPVPIAAQFPTVEFSVDGVNWAFAFTIPPTPGTGGRGFGQGQGPISINAAKFVRVTLFSTGPFPILSNINVTPMTACAC